MTHKIINVKNIIAVALLMFLMAVVVKCAWIVDDSYISFRYVKNILSGYGLTWNTFERVQAYTNPLYVFLMIPLYAIFGDMFLSSIVLSVALTMSAVTISLFPKDKKSIIPFIICILALSTSKAFIDYSTSGLENPMTYLIIALFYKEFFTSQKPYESKSFLKLCLIASFITINRVDAILLFIPPLCYGFFKQFKFKKILMGLLGFLPFIIWEAFSFFYYGFFFPNTAYAKLNITTSAINLVKRGFKYIFSSNIYGDNITLVVLLAVLILGVFLSRKLHGRFKIASASILLYLAYIVYVGGDFMVGRFLAAPFFLAIILLYEFGKSLNIEFKSFKSLKEKLAIAFCLFILFFGLIPETSPITSPISYERYYDYQRYTNPLDRPRDVRSFYYEEAGLAHYLKQTIIDGAKADRVIHKWGHMGSEYDEDKVYVSGGIGFMGYFAPSETKIIDIYALTDPLLSRIPSPPDLFAGHHEREIPAGYEETVRTGENVIVNPSLKQYYDKIHLIVSGDLFDINRLKIAFNMNLGKYDYLIEDYRETLDY